MNRHDEWIAGNWMCLMLRGRVCTGGAGVYTRRKHDSRTKGEDRPRSGAALRADLLVGFGRRADEPGGALSERTCGVCNDVQSQGRRSFEPGRVGLRMNAQVALYSRCGGADEDDDAYWLSGGKEGQGRRNKLFGVPAVVSLRGPKAIWD